MADHISENAPVDQQLSLPHDQTVLGSYLFAWMLEALQLEPWHRVLEIGTGSGYSAAVLSMLVREVYSLERIPTVADSAGARLTTLGYDEIAVRCAEGAMGWPAYAPYDAILVEASAATIPPALLEQLAEGGRLVMPIGDTDRQRLVCVVKTGAVTESTSLGPVRFAPLVAARTPGSELDDCQYGGRPESAGSELAAPSRSAGELDLGDHSRARTTAASSSRPADSSQSA